MELKIVKFFNRLGRGTAVDALTKFVSDIFLLAGGWAVLTVLIFFFVEDGKNAAMAMTVAAGLHFLITEGFFKRLLAMRYYKTRPYAAYPGDIEAIGGKQLSSAFPSSHVSANVAVLSVVVYFFPVFWPLALAFGLLVAFARIHNGMHYFSDVVAGTVLGITYGLAAIYLVKNYSHVLS